MVDSSCASHKTLRTSKHGGGSRVRTAHEGHVNAVVSKDGSDPPVDAGEQAIGRAVGRRPEQVTSVVRHLGALPHDRRCVQDLKKAPLLFRKAHAVPSCSRGMQRVVVVGGGLAGLAAALEAASSGHKVVVLEARDRLGGRATTTPGRYADLGHGPHVLLRGGTMHQLVRRLSRTRPATLALAPHRLNVVGHGPLRSLRSVRATAAIRRTLRSSTPSDEPAVKAARLLAGWGLPAVHGPLGARAEALYMGQGLLLHAGWADLIGRVLAALDEAGVPIETNAKVIAVEDGCVHLEDGRDLEADLVVVAAG
ncbi:MAG TPA: FAD-dependent oxidoreductase, partial [Candidatus Poseidoniales archaeon]